MLLMMHHPDPPVQIPPLLQPPTLPPSQPLSPLLTLISPPPDSISRPFLPCSPPALQSNLCNSPLPSLLSLCLISNPPSSVMCPLVPLDPWFQLFFAIDCSCLFTGFLILVCKLHKDFSLHGLSLAWIGQGPQPRDKALPPLPAEQDPDSSVILHSNYSGSPEMFSLSTITTESCARAFLQPGF